MTQLEASTEKMKQAETDLADAQAKLQNFVSANFQATPQGMMYVSAENRDKLDDELKTLTAAVDKRKAEFHHALSVWSALK